MTNHEICDYIFLAKPSTKSKQSDISILHAARDWHTVALNAALRIRPLLQRPAGLLRFDGAIPLTSLGSYYSYMLLICSHDLSL